MPWPEPVSLHVKIVSVALLNQSHCDALKEAAADGELYKL
jgi:hypothetical protein